MWDFQNPEIPPVPFMSQHMAIHAYAGFPQVSPKFGNRPERALRITARVRYLSSGGVAHQVREFHEGDAHPDP